MTQTSRVHCRLKGDDQIGTTSWQLAAVQKALQEQQELLLAKAEEHARQQENSFQLAAQSQQLAALQASPMTQNIFMTCT